jgi:molecular chaperone HscB
MTPSSSVSDVDFFPDDVNALLNHRSCFRAAALFEEDTHALKKIGKEGIAFVASSLSSRASFPVVASTIVRICAFTLKRKASDDPFHFPETVTQCEVKRHYIEDEYRAKTRETLVIMLSHRAMRNAMMVLSASERELFSSSTRTGRQRDFVSSSASSFPQRAGAKFACWSCFTEQHSQGDKEEDDGEEEISFFCKKCAAIKHPNAFHDVSHYRLLSVPERFSVDVKRVELSMKNLQKRLHPDKFSSAGGQMKREKEYSEEISARVNEAYGKLRDPLLRAKYLFGLKTGAAYDGAEETETNGDEAREEVPPELLFLVMEVREAIEEADEDGEELIKLKEENEERMEEAERRVGEALDDEVEFDAEKARKAIVELTYFEKIRKEIIERL